MNAAVYSPRQSRVHSAVLQSLPPKMPAITTPACSHDTNAQNNIAQHSVTHVASQNPHVTRNKEFARRDCNRNAKVTDRVFREIGSGCSSFRTDTEAVDHNMLQQHEELRVKQQ